MDHIIKFFQGSKKSRRTENDENGTEDDEIANPPKRTRLAHNIAEQGQIPSSEVSENGNASVEMDGPMDNIAEQERSPDSGVPENVNESMQVDEPMEEFANEPQDEHAVNPMNDTDESESDEAEYLAEYRERRARLGRYNLRTGDWIYPPIRSNYGIWKQRKAEATEDSNNDNNLGQPIGQLELENQD